MTHREEILQPSPTHMGHIPGKCHPLCYMLRTAYVLHGKILICNNNLFSLYPFPTQQFPVLTEASSLITVFLQPGKLRDSRGNGVIRKAMPRKIYLAGEKSTESKILMGQKSLWKREEVLQSFRHSSSAQATDSPEYKDLNKGTQSDKQVWSRTELDRNSGGAKRKTDRR